MRRWNIFNKQKNASKFNYITENKDGELILYEDYVVEKADLKEEIESIQNLCNDIKSAYLKQEFFHMGELVEILKERVGNLV